MNLKRTWSFINQDMETKRKAYITLLDSKQEIINVGMWHNQLWYYPNRNTLVKGNTIHHLYITTDDEIKEGDWVYCEWSEYSRKVYKVNEIKADSYIDTNGYMHVKKQQNFRIQKIIATTDPELTYCVGKCTNDWATEEDNLYAPLPKLSKDFIGTWADEYNNGKEPKEVMVAYVKEAITTGESRFNNGYPVGTKVFIMHHDNVSINPKNNKECVCCTKNLKDANHDWFGYELGNLSPIQDVPKVDANNYITISPVKDSWSREETIELCREAFKAGEMHCATIGKVYGQSPDFDQWINDKL